MRLEQAELYHIAVPLVSPFETSSHRTVVREALLVCLRAGGETGWGEVVADTTPWYSGETLAGARLALRDHLLPLVLGHDAPTVETLLARLAPVKGNQMARAGLEMAWWDLRGRTSGQSLGTMLGAVRDRVRVGVSVGVQPDIATLVETVGGYLQAGYGRIKIKVKPGWLAAPVHALREAFAPNLPLQVDANSAFTLADAPLFQEIDDAGLLLIEQPLADDDLVDHAALAAQLQTPICLDESIHSLAAARAALALHACAVINIKAGRVGGLHAARAIHDLCLDAGVPVWCGGMLETGIGRAANLALAALPNFHLPADISASARYYAQDITAPFTLNRDDSTITVPTAPGLGVEVLLGELARVTVGRETVWPL